MSGINEVKRQKPRVFLQRKDKCKGLVGRG